MDLIPNQLTNEMVSYSRQFDRFLQILQAQRQSNAEFLQNELNTFTYLVTEHLSTACVPPGVRDFRNLLWSFLHHLNHTFRETLGQSSGLLPHHRSCESDFRKQSVWCGRCSKAIHRKLLVNMLLWTEANNYESLKLYYYYYYYY